jgi:16S rRNA (guanine527-N7)-methyltransferase
MSRSQPTNRTQHIRGPQDFGAAFHVSRETLARLQLYQGLLVKWQLAVNLVSANTLDEVWHRHFADSAQLLPLAGTPRSWLDFGSGAGFPGLVVAILLADRPSDSPPRVTLVEPNARKCAFLHEVVRRAQLAPPWIAVDILSTRIEVLATQGTLAPPEVVSARAVAPLDKLLRLSAPLFDEHTVGLFPKGRDAAAELHDAESRWDFEADLVPSRTEPAARIIAIRRPRAKMNAKPKD